MWALFLDGADRGYGYLRNDVPELSLCGGRDTAVRGVGGELLRRALEEARRRGVGRVSLSMEAANPAVHLYRAVGSRPVPAAAEGTFAVDL